MGQLWPTNYVTWKDLVLDCWSPAKREHSAFQSSNGPCVSFVVLLGLRDVGPRIWSLTPVVAARDRSVAAALNLPSLHNLEWRFGSDSLVDAICRVPAITNNGSRLEQKDLWIALYCSSNRIIGCNQISSVLFDRIFPTGIHAYTNMIIPLAPLSFFDADQDQLLHMLKDAEQTNAPASSSAADEKR